MKPAALILSFLSLTAIALAQQAPAQPASGLRIVVIDGEDAVNIVQQKTAVRPVVEVRDRNNLPVAGALVQFTIARGAGVPAGAFANGQSVVTATTDVAGRAAAANLQAVGPGTLRIQVQATFQGQSATATITQTNFATATQAAQAGRAPTQSSSAGSAGSSGVGGAVSTAGTIAGIAAAGITGAAAIHQAQQNNSCASNGDEALASIGSAVNTCGGTQSSSPQCRTAGQQAADSLGAWCSCDGTAAVDASLRAQGTSLDQLSQLATFGNVAFPASCR
jgi:hypothetical protein